MTELPRLNLKWTCSACGVDETSGRDSRIICIEDADRDEVVCATCDHDGVEQKIRDARATRDLELDHQREREELEQLLDRCGVPRDGHGRMYSIVQRVGVLARWATPRMKR